MSDHYVTLWAMSLALKVRTLVAYSSPWPRVEIMGERVRFNHAPKAVKGEWHDEAGTFTEGMWNKLERGS